MSFSPEKLAIPVHYFWVLGRKDMYSNNHNLLVIFVIFLGFANPVSSGEQDDATKTTEELIEGVIARSEAVFSGIIEYHQKRGFGNDTKKFPEGEYRFIFSGSSWRLHSKYVASEIPISYSKKWKGPANDPKLDGLLENTELSHKGKYVNYRVTPQPDRAVRNTARITNEKTLDSLFKTYNGPPVFAGSFWFECTREFIRRHKDRAVRKADVEVNGIKSHVLEWAVSDSEKFEAFHAARRGGLLRLYISSELGFVLPKLEHIGSDGLVDATYDSCDFKEHAPGIFMPRNSRMQKSINRVPGFYVDYEITAVSQLNDPIPDKEFVIQLPSGTIVADSRSGKSSTMFAIQQGSPIPGDLDDIVADQTPRFWGRNWHSALILGIGGGVLLLVLFVLWRRG